MTLSIVARDPNTGDLGVAVVTGFFAVGAAVPFVEAGVGAIASQAMSEPTYGHQGLAALRNRTAPTEVLAAIRADDPLASVRQVGMVDRDGQVAAFTGELCVEAAMDLQGDGFSVQGNMLASPEVVPAAAEAFTRHGGSLVERLLSGVRAAVQAGGDQRGHQSAAARVVAGAAGTNPWDGVSIDVRVDDHPQPVDELDRLVTLARAFRGLDHAITAMMGGDLTTALARSEEAHALAPLDPNVAFGRAGVLWAAGERDDAATLTKQLFERDPQFREWVRRFAATGLLPMTADELDMILAL